MPLNVPSTCRAPALTAASELATASPKIIVAMHADHCIVNVPHVVTQIGDQRGILLWNGEAHGVGDIHRGGPRVDGRLHDTGQKFRLGARRILGRKLDILHKAFARLTPSMASRTISSSAFFNLNSRWMAEVARKTWIRASSPAGLTAAPAASMSLGTHRASPQMIGPPDFRGDGSNRLEIAIADDGKTGLDHINVEPGQLAGDFHFLAQVHAGARALLAVAQRRIENNYLSRHRMNGCPAESEERIAALTTPAGNAAYAGL